MKHHRRGSNRDSIRFFYMARGSATELSTQIDIAQAVELLESPRAHDVMNDCAEVEAMLMRLIMARSGGQVEARG